MTFGISWNGERALTIDGFEYTLAPDLGVLADLRHALAAWLEQAEIGDRAWADIVLATHEAAANAIEHAESSESVHISGRLMEGSVVVEITDTGLWKPAGPPDENRGRGLQLIGKLVTQLEIQTHPNGTTLRLLCRV